MRLFIAEKPSLARAIADVLPGPQRRRDGHIECGTGDIVAWCAGHILELAPPDVYDARYKQWRLEDLPIVPDPWKLSPSAPALLKTIKVLLRGATRVVHAGDPDREGQLLVDEVLEFLGYRGPIDRLLISDLNPPAVRRSIGEIRSNGHYRGLYEAALARQRADWLYGINLTRLYTVLGRAGGYGGVLSVGRVQTPLLGLIVRRDAEIEGFRPRPYFVVRAEIGCAEGRFKATWQPPRDASEPVDDEGRLVSRERAIAIRTNVEGKAGAVVRATREKKSEPPPLPHSLPELQIDAGKRLGLTPKQTLDACQALYETHRLLTYPRSDCSFLPEGHHDRAGVVLAAVATNAPALARLLGAADRSRRSRAWSDKKVTAHHAIIPTEVAKPDAPLSPAERGIYELVARRYAAQFLAPFEFNETKVEIDVAGERFRASGRETIAEGWRVLVSPAPDDGPADAVNEIESEPGQRLPYLRDGEAVAAASVAITDKQTTPPRRFTDATLIQAMTGIARFVADPKIRQLLRETDGIGTPATQAQIIQTLFDRKFIERRGRQIESTAIGRALIQSLPAIATRPDMTALWEAAMRRIADGQMALSAFLGAVVQQLRELVMSGRALRSLRMPSGAGVFDSTRSPPRGRRPRSSGRRPASGAANGQPATPGRERR
jgi:DNA topoisomerase III